MVDDKVYVRSTLKGPFIVSNLWSPSPPPPPQAIIILTSLDGVAMSVMNESPLGNLWFL